MDATIDSSVSSSVIKEIQTCETAKLMWDSLATLYEENNPNRFVSLNQEMFSTKFENCKDMSEYIEKMRSIGIKMRTILPTYPDQAVAANILTDLPSYFRPLTMALENSVQELTTDLVCERLLAEYAKTGGNQEQSAFPMKFSADNSRFTGKCNNCGKFGHKAKFCRVRNKNGYDYPNRKDTKDAKQKPDSHPKVREVWVLTSDLNYSSSDERWIVDSDCDRQMTSCREIFETFNESVPCSVKTGGGMLHSVGKGSVIFSIVRDIKTMKKCLVITLKTP